MKEQIKKYLRLREKLESIKENMDRIKNNLIIDMEIKELEYFEDDEGNDIIIKKSSRKSLNKDLVKSKLNEEIFNECFKISEFTTVSIRSKDRREQQKKFKKVKQNEKNRF